MGLLASCRLVVARGAECFRSGYREARLAKSQFLQANEQHWLEHLSSLSDGVTGESSLISPEVWLQGTYECISKPEKVQL